MPMTPEQQAYWAKQGSPVEPEYSGEAHPELPWSERQMYTAQSSGPEQAGRALQERGWETSVKDGHLYVRKPGEPTWKRVDEAGFSLLDIPDVADEALTGLMAGAGSLLGLGGAAVGAGGAQALKQLAGRASGLESTPQEATRQIGTEMAMGAGGELLGRGLGAGLRAAGGQVAKRLPGVAKAFRGPPEMPTTAKAVQGVGRLMQAPGRLPGELFERSMTGGAAQAAKKSSMANLESLLAAVDAGVDDTAMTRFIAQNPGVKADIENIIRRPFTSIDDIRQANQLLKSIAFEQAEDIARPLGTAAVKAESAVKMGAPRGQQAARAMERGPLAKADVKVVKAKQGAQRAGERLKQTTARTAREKAALEERAARGIAPMPADEAKLAQAVPRAASEKKIAQSAARRAVAERAALQRDIMALEKQVAQHKDAWADPEIRHAIKNVRQLTERGGAKGLRHRYSRLAEARIAYDNLADELQSRGIKIGGLAESTAMPAALREGMGFARQAATIGGKAVKPATLAGGGFLGTLNVPRLRSAPALATAAAAIGFPLQSSVALGGAVGALGSSWLGKGLEALARVPKFQGLTRQVEQLLKTKGARAAAMYLALQARKNPELQRLLPQGGQDALPQ